MIRSLPAFFLFLSTALAVSFPVERFMFDSDVLAPPETYLNLGELCDLHRQALRPLAPERAMMECYLMPGEPAFQRIRMRTIELTMELAGYRRNSQGESAVLTGALVELWARNGAMFTFFYFGAEDSLYLVVARHFLR